MNNAYIKRLTGYKTNVLKQVSVNCGITLGNNKEETVRKIVQGISFQDEFPKDAKIIAIDVGIKNLAFCKLEFYDFSKPILCHGKIKKLNLHEIYGANYKNMSGYMDAGVNSSRYLSYLVYELLDDIFLKEKYYPNILAVENQRTRSNRNSATIPNVLLNYTLEHMLYAGFHGIQRTRTELVNSYVMPMNSSKMTNFWINRFIEGKKIITKKARVKLFYHWLTSEIAPFHNQLELTDHFINLPSAKKAREVQNALGITDTSTKMDDIVDCFFYALMIQRQLLNIKKLHEALKSGTDIEVYVERLNDEQRSIISGLKLD